jgi:hypothetical protein
MSSDHWVHQLRKDTQKRRGKWTQIKEEREELRKLCHKMTHPDGNING